MATVPLSGSHIRLINVPFNSDYKNTRWFDSLSEQTTYFLNKSAIFTIDQFNFQRINGSYVVRVNKNIDSLWGTNYLLFQNADYNNKWFYAFVDQLEYINKNVTHIHFEIDVFQTWLFDINFKPSFVIREHRPLWNGDGSPVINTVDEGLAYGTEYDTQDVNIFQPNNGYKWLVIVSKTPMHEGSPTSITPTVIGTPQPLSVYLVPFKDDDTVPSVDMVKQQMTALISKPTDVLKNLYTSSDAVNNIVALYVTEYTGIPFTLTSGSPDIMQFPDDGNDIQAVVVAGSSNIHMLYVAKVLNFDSLSQDMGSKYDGFAPVTESKLMMYPYCQTIIDDFKGNRMTLKNEYINNTNLLLLVKGSLGTSNYVSYGVDDYNYTADGTAKERVSNESALINNNPADVPIITDQLAAYLQGHRNSLANQKQQIEWNGVTGAVGNALGGIGSALSGNALGAAASATGIVKGAGDTVLKLQGIEAKQQDIANLPPQLAKMGSNTSYLYGNNYNGVYVMKKQIKAEYRKKLSDFFNMFGYKTNEVKVPNFHTRQSWNYVQTQSCIITGNFNNEDLQEIKNVFDNGITLWHTDDIGNYSLGNAVIA